MSDEIPIPNPPLSADEVAAFAELSQSAKDAIDEAVLSCALPRWRKVAMVVGLVMDKLRNQYPQFSDVFYGERVRALADQGRLESQGDLSCPRFSEVRLPDESDEN